MKSNQIFQIVLAIAVAVLYFLHFSGKKIVREAISEDEGGLYFINIDTLNSKLKFLAEKQEDLEAKEISFDAKFKEKASALEREIGEYQRQAQGGFLTPKQMQTMEQRLGRKQQELMMERDSIAGALLRESQAINDELMKRLKHQLDEFRKTNESQYIFGYSDNGNILYANKSMDITEEILKKMNAEK